MLILLTDINLKIRHLLLIHNTVQYYHIGEDFWSLKFIPESFVVQFPEFDWSCKQNHFHYTISAVLRVIKAFPIFYNGPRIFPNELCSLIIMTEPYLNWFSSRFSIIENDTWSSHQQVWSTIVFYMSYSDNWYLSFLQEPVKWNTNCGVSSCWRIDTLSSVYDPEHCLGSCFSSYPRADSICSFKPSK